MDHQGVGKVLNAAAAHVAALTSGIEASSEVASMCIGGHSLGQLFVYVSSFELDSRHSGMKKAFGEDMEILQSTRDSPPQDLSTADFDKLISNAEAAHAASRAAAQHAQSGYPSVAPNNAGVAQRPGGTNATEQATSTPASNGPLPTVHQAITNDISPRSPTAPTPETTILPIDAPNPFLAVHANFPLIKWGRSVHHPFITFIYTTIALCSMLALLILKWWKGGSWTFEAVYFTTFIIVNLYTILMLDVTREICYIEVSERDVSPGLRDTWQSLKAEAKPFPETKEEALEILRRGFVCHRRAGETLLVGVMAVVTRIEDEPASWWMLLNELRGPLVQLGLYLLPDDEIDWIMVYGITAYAQARLQRAVTERYIKDAKTRRIIWFRRLKEHHKQYPIFEYTFRLDAFDQCFRGGR